MTVEFIVKPAATIPYKRVQVFNQLLICTEQEAAALHALLVPCRDADFVWREE